MAGHHVHALVGKAGIVQRLLAHAQLEHPVVLLRGKIQRAVACAAIRARRDFVGRHTTRAEVLPHPGQLERAGSFVIVRTRTRFGVSQRKVLARHRGVEVVAARVAIAAIEPAERALCQQTFIRLGKGQRFRLHLHGAAQAVAAHAHRGDAGEHVDAFDARRIDIGQHRIHVIGASGSEIHAVDLDAQAFVGQPAQHRQAGKSAGAVDACAWYVFEQARGIVAAIAEGVECLAVDARRAGSHGLAAHHDRIEHGCRRPIQRRFSLCAHPART